MNIRSGPRPLTIRIFAAAFLSAALIAFLKGIGDIPRAQAAFAAQAPMFEWSHDAVIVVLSARLSIALIPIALVWLTAANFARWMVTIIALAKALSIFEAVRLITAGSSIDTAWLAELVLAMVATVMLFMPASNAWFAKPTEPDAAVFE
ncbi:MAG: hypothetical protein ACXIT4_02225 [Erythrobacter sp.]